MNHYGSVIATKDDLRVIVCEICGIKHLDPIPTTTRDYPSGFYHCVVKPTMREDYEQDAKWWKETHLDWLSLVPAWSGARLLDVGCGTGAFVQVAREVGFYVVGIEPDPELAQCTSGVLWCEYRDYLDTHFGIVSAHWTLEHLPDPNHFMQWARDRLCDGGYLLVTIPNDFSLIQYTTMAAIGRWYYWLDRYHINYWNRHDFVSFAQRHNFETLATHGSWQPERSLIDGVNYLDEPSIGKSLHKAVAEHDLQCSRAYRRSKYRLWGERGIGRDLTYAMRKV